METKKRENQFFTPDTKAKTNWIGRDCERKEIYYEEWMFEEGEGGTGAGFTLACLLFKSKIKNQENFMFSRLTWLSEIFRKLLNYDTTYSRHQLVTVKNGDDYM